MKHVMTVIKKLYGDSWEGSVFFDENDEIKEIIPNQGCEMLDINRLKNEAPLVEANENLKEQISALEASITPRRIREAVLSTEGETWLKGVNDQITTLRGQLS